MFPNTPASQNCYLLWVEKGFDLALSSPLSFLDRGKQWHYSSTDEALKITHSLRKSALWRHWNLGAGYLTLTNQTERPKVPIGGTTGLKRAVHSTATHMWPQSRLYWCRATWAHLSLPQLWYQWHRAEPLPMLNLCFHSPYKMEKHNFPPAPERQNGENKNKQKEKIPLVRWT